MNRTNTLTYNPNMLAKFCQIGDELCGSYIVDDETKFVAENVIKWLIGDESMQQLKESRAKKHKYKPGRLDKGIYIAGDCGTGKSLILRILKEFARCVNTKFVINGKTIGTAWHKYHARELTSKFRNGEDLSGLYKVPVIQIDDLGAEPNPCQYMGNKIDLLADLLETREDKGVITLITSNLPPDYLSDTYGDRLESRMGALNYYELNGDDKRCQ